LKPLEKTLFAARFAAQKHAGQFRKGKSRQPYFIHPLEVAELVARVGEIEDADLLAAALLHDTVEDCGVTETDLRELFGSKVARLVAELTDDKSLPENERRAQQITRSRLLSSEAKVIKLADKISNIREMLDDPPDWPLKRRQEYVDWGIKVVENLRGANRPLERAFDELIDRARRELG
jgi:guanosine-3',5'-bis(diphosphate) 3'-pyrophosphohydrolase